MLPRLTAAVAALAVLVLVPTATAGAAARPATAAEKRAVRAAIGDRCATAARGTQVAVSTRDRRYAIYNWDDGFRATTLCSAIVRRRSARSRKWRVVELVRGTRAFDRSIQRCPRALPRDLRGTIWPRGGGEPLVYCGN